MKKKFIIKDARRLLAEQINSSQIVEGKNMNIETMSKMKGLSEVIPKDNDGYCTVYKMDCADGLGLMTVYQAFPGIQLIYNDFEATEYEWEGIFDKNILEINHCREGREGSRLLSGSCLYLGEGDLSIHTMDNCASEMSFPLKHYRGISVVINLETVSKILQQFWRRQVLILWNFGISSVRLEIALSCGQKMKLSIFFRNCILYRIACKNRI